MMVRTRLVQTIIQDVLIYNNKIYIWPKNLIEQIDMWIVLEVVIQSFD